MWRCLGIVAFRHCGVRGASSLCRASLAAAESRACPRAWQRACTSSAQPLRRGSGPVDDRSPRELVAGSRSNVGKLAGALAAQIRAHNHGVLSTVGPEAAYCALKAVIIAKKYLEDTHPDQSLAVVPRKRTVKDNFKYQGATDATPADVVTTLLYVHPVTTPCLPEAPEIFAAGDTNTGLMAGLMAKLLEGKEVGTVGAMGPMATSKAIKAMMICETYLEKNLGQETIGAVPTLNQFRETWREEDRVRMMLTCLRTRRPAEDLAQFEAKV